ncbi:GNAT family N-acetyltransferase [Massilia sp. S19_KUP03_FR1]|uniref:GNAT family N-acetyltransferase n=1 Tax=Massilia sp. S19_KUP03_FR1 TaxID=3025503 RepID=UPI002FCD725D
MDKKIVIRPAVDADYPAMAAMLRTLATAFIVPGMPPEAGATFLRDNDEAALRAYRDRGHVASVAEIEGRLAGYIALRPPSHVFHLFVDHRWHRRGVARALWRAACAQAAPAAIFTVNSSPYAVPAYEALGFRCDGAAQCRNGVTFQPMVCARARNA